MSDLIPQSEMFILLGRPRNSDEWHTLSSSRDLETARKFYCRAISDEAGDNRYYALARRTQTFETLNLQPTSVCMRCRERQETERGLCEICAESRGHFENEAAFDAPSDFNED